MFATPEYAGFVKIHKELEALAGTPPFDVVLGKRDARALSFEELRKKVLEVARDGVPLQRFKGLGEMNADQLFETTMDPEQRHPAAGDDRRRERGRPGLLDADGRRRRAAPRVHRDARPRSRPTWTCRGAPHVDRPADRREHRATRARGGDALLVPRLRHERDRGPRAAGRARRPQARAPARALLDARGRPAAQPALPQGVARGRRRDGPVPPARRRRDLRHPGAARPGLRDALPAGRAAGQLRLDRQRPAGGDAVLRDAATRAWPRPTGRSGSTGLVAGR